MGKTASGGVSPRETHETVHIHVIDFPVRHLLRLRQLAPYAGEHATASRILTWGGIVLAQ